MDTKTFGIRGIVASIVVLLATASVPASTYVISNGSNTSIATALPMNQNPDLVIQQLPPNFTLATAQNVSPQWSGSNAIGTINPILPSEYFAFNANVGSSIALQVNSTNPTSKDVELLLYDPNGNLVAIADGNAPDGASSIIDYSVPNGDPGNWSAEVTSSPSAPGADFPYDLQISGATGLGPVYPLPEPGALTIFAGSLLTLCKRRRR